MLLNMERGQVFFLKGLAQKHKAEVVFYNSQKSVNNEFSLHKNVNN